MRRTCEASHTNTTPAAISATFSTRPVSAEPTATTRESKRKNRTSWSASRSSLNIGVEPTSARAPSRAGGYRSEADAALAAAAGRVSRVGSRVCLKRLVGGSASRCGRRTSAPLLPSPTRSTTTTSSRSRCPAWSLVLCSWVCQRTGVSTAAELPQDPWRCPCSRGIALRPPSGLVTC
jgi:hypothetical protein